MEKVKDKFMCVELGNERLLSRVSKWVMISPEFAIG